MAEALVSMLLDQISLIFQVNLAQKMKLATNVRNKVKELTTMLNTLRVVIRDAEVKQLKDEAIELWLRRIKNLLYEANDVLDEEHTRVLKGVNANGFRSGIKAFSISSKRKSYFKSNVVRREFFRKIEEIKEEFVVILRDKDLLNLTESYSYEEHLKVTSSAVGVSEIIGRDVDKEIIVNRLLGESSRQAIRGRVPVISIVGEGGLGKTSLARLVFNEENVTVAFERKMWVLVSECFDLERVSQSIFEQAKIRVRTNAFDWEPWNRAMWDDVKNKRFLLVLDGVSTDGLNHWHTLQHSLDHGVIGSRIIITTRSEEVARLISSTYTHQISQLSDVDCWAVIHQVPLWKRPQESNDRFEEVGRQIAKKCEGFPLAAKILASLLRFKSTKQDWRNILESDVWEFAPVGNVIVPAIFLSYQSLPSYLKQCFVYCATFPRGEELGKDNLIKLWLAQGLLGSNGEEELEMIGGEYFDELVMRSFFEEFDKSDSGNISKCKMHALVYDFAQFLTKTECLSSGVYNTEIGRSEVRHLIALDVSDLYFHQEMDLHTLIVRLDKPIDVGLLFQHKCLRVLDLCDSNIEVLPSEVESLLHLRYLDLSMTRLSQLPESLCNLFNLQTLRLNGCQRLLKLPERIGLLSNLRHVEVEDTPALNYLPKGIGKLYFLRTLSKWINVGVSGESNIEELGSLYYLTGEIKIIGLVQVKDFSEAKEAKLQKKNKLSSLTLSFGYHLDEEEVDIKNMESVFQGYHLSLLEEDMERMEDVLHEDDIKRMDDVLCGLQPHNNLEKLEINDYLGSGFPFWMSSKSLLSNVAILELRRCKNCIQLPALGNLESLESLYIGELHSVKYIGPEFYGAGAKTFPKLKKLWFNHMHELVVWAIPFANYESVMPHLCELGLRSCKTIKILPAFGRLESLESIWIEDLPSVKRLGVEFLGISSGNGEDSESRIVDIGDREVVFPRLTKLSLSGMVGLEDCNFLLPFRQSGEVMPFLRHLNMSNCPRLTVLPPALANLNSVTIKYSQLSSLPQGLNQLTSLQELVIEHCELLNFEPLEELRQISMLQELNIFNCSTLSMRFSGVDGTILSGLPFRIIVDGEDIATTGRIQNLVYYSGSDDEEISGR